MVCSRCAKDLEADSTFCRFCGAPTAGRDGGKRLYRVPAQGQIAGVCAGIASYFDADVTIVRLAWVILSLIPGMVIGGVLAYVAAWLLMPAVDPAAVPAPTGKRLLRSSADRRIAGVCGGLSEYLGIDPTVVRLVCVILAIYPGAVIGGVIAYLIAWFIIPSAPPIPIPVQTPA